MVILYNYLILLGFTITIPFLIVLTLTSKKRRETFLKRLGMQPLPGKHALTETAKHEKRPIWVHALSVGETISVVPLVKKLRKRIGHGNIVLSVSTTTGFQIANKVLREDVSAIFYFPYDLMPSVRHVTRKVRPRGVVLVETDIWPSFLFEMKRRGIGVVLVNARISERSARGYGHISFFTKPLFQVFAFVCAQTVKDAGRLERLGVPRQKLRVTGNLKYDREEDPPVFGNQDRMRLSLNIPPGQRVIVAGSTHKGEEEILLDAFLRTNQMIRRLLLIIVPRDPARAESVCRIFQSAGLAADRMGRLKRVDRGPLLDVIVVDRIGLLGRLYALADVAFVGGSLVRRGGQNPLEPALFSKPVLFGPDMSDFEEIAQDLLKAGGALRVDNAVGLSETVIAMLRDHRKARLMGKRAYGVYSANRGAVERTLDVIQPYLWEGCAGSKAGRSFLSS
jgi:3-deoxy-D-manno-octulosonic-acid transferase